jgi:phosphomannomutase
MSSGGAGAPARKNILVLFDVDGTLTPSRKAVTPATTAFLAALRGRVTTGMVGGSDLPKQLEQLGEGVLHMFDYVFPENGLKAFKDGALIGQTSFLDKLGEERLKALVNFVLGYLSTLDIPKKRGTFIEFRTGMLNVSPIGRNCSQAERDEFERYDAAHGVRAAMVAALQAQFGHLGLKCSIGGQISFDVFPQGWDKTFCLRFLQADGFADIHFFGDKTFPGGNDYEIFTHPEVKGHTTTGPDDTVKQCRELFLSAAK